MQELNPYTNATAAAFQHGGRQQGILETNSLRSTHDTGPKTEFSVPNASIPWTNNTEPMYRHIFRHLRSEIERGRYQAGDRLPSVRTMVTEFQVSHPTILRALEELAAIGYVKLVQGSGSYVAKRSVFKQFQTPVSSEPAISKTAQTRDLVSVSTKRPLKHSDKNLHDTDNPEGVLPLGRWRTCIRTAIMDCSATPVSPLGLQSLRVAIASYVRRSRGICADASQVIVTSGLASSIALIATLRDLNGQQAAVETPGSPKIRRLLAANGAVVSPIELDAQGLSIDTLKESQAGFKLLHLTPNHNPTGLVMSERRRQSLLNWASHEQVIVVEDDFGCEFALSLNGETPLFSLDQNMVIYLGGFWSSLFPLANTSFLLLPPALAEEVARTSHLRDAEQNLLEQHALRLMLDDGHLELHLKRRKKSLMEKRAAAISALKQTLGARVDIIGTGTNNKQLVRFREDIEARTIVKAALRSGLPLANTADYYSENQPTNEFLLSFNSIERTRIFNTVLHFSGLLE